jgi:hypothetical protein
MRPRLRHLLVCTLAAVAGSGALAFSFIGSRWTQPTVTVHVGMSGTSPSGIAWSTALTDAVNQWNEKTDFTLVADPTYASPCGNAPGVYGTDFGTTGCGISFGNSTLAVTLTNSGFVPSGFGFSTFTRTSIVFNSAYSWDVYDGPRRSRIDFRRVALHELGHVIGLDHESSEAAIMQPAITDLYTLQPDDIAGVNALYGGNTSGSCLVRDVSANATRSETLTNGDCRVRDIFGGTDTSFIDVYRLRLTKTTTLDFTMSSSELDSVLILSNANFENIEVFDDTNGQCDARFSKTLPAGEYRLMANTYVTPEKCAGNTGGYSLTVSDSGMPTLDPLRNAAGGTLANAVISGGATTDGTTYASAFTANQAINVLGRIVPDPQHVGLDGRIYVLAVLGDGRQFMKNSSGQFVAYGGGIANLVPTRTGTLAAVENVSIATGLQGSVSGLAGQTVYVFVGYALSSAPQQIWYGSTPITFTIDP